MNILIRSMRFLYLFWSSLLLGMLIVANHIQIPSFAKKWTLVYFLLISPWGRGLLLSITVVMLLAAIFEIWELIDKLLKNSNQENKH